MCYVSHYSSSAVETSSSSWQNLRTVFMCTCIHVFVCVQALFSLHMGPPHQHFLVSGALHRADCSCCALHHADCSCFSLHCALHCSHCLCISLPGTFLCWLSLGFSPSSSSSCWLFLWFSSLWCCSNLLCWRLCATVDEDDISAVMSGFSLLHLVSKSQPGALSPHRRLTGLCCVSMSSAVSPLDVLLMFLDVLLRSFTEHITPVSLRQQETDFVKNEETVPLNGSSCLYFTNTPHPEWNLCECDLWPLLFKLVIPAPVFCIKMFSCGNHWYQPCSY